MISKLSVENSRHAYSYDNSIQIDERVLMNYLNKGIGRFIPKSIETVNVSLHVLERWKTRIHPYMTESEIKEYIQMAFLCNRLTLIDGIAHIDNDIYFAYAKSGTTVDLITTYGREALMSKEVDMVRYIKYYKEAKDHITLELSEEQLLNLPLPALPETYIKYKGSISFYRMAIYKTTQGYVYDVEINNNSRRRVICTNKDTRGLSKSNRRIINSVYQVS